jgi:hypothetical protein
MRDNKTITRNFEAFTKRLLQNGIPLSTVNAIRDHVSKFTRIGKDPIFKVVDNGIVIERKLFPLKSKKDKGLGSIASIADNIFGGGGNSASADNWWQQSKDAVKSIPTSGGNTFGDVFSNGGGFSWDSKPLEPSTFINLYGEANNAIRSKNGSTQRSNKPELRRKYSTAPMPVENKTSVNNTDINPEGNSNTMLYVAGGLALSAIPFFFLMKKSTK